MNATGLQPAQGAAMVRSKETNSLTTIPVRPVGKHREEQEALNQGPLKLLTPTDEEGGRCL